MVRFGQSGTILITFYLICGIVRERFFNMWWNDLLWGFWNGLTAWIVLIVHIFGGWDHLPLFDATRDSNWYGAGFLTGAGSPFLGMFRKRS